MSFSAISATIASVALAFLILGFIFGWVRGYQKSLTRLIIVLVVAVIAFFVTPAITDAVLNAKISGAVVNGNAVATVKDYIIEQIKQVEQIREIMDASPTMQAFVIALPSMLVNVVLFVVVFFLLKWISMIIYWIFAGTLFNKKRLEGKSKIKLLGAGIGTLQALIAVAIILVPVFGFVNIEKQILNEYDASRQTVVASSTTNDFGATLVSSEEGSSNSQDNGIKIEENVQKADKYVVAFENTWVVKVYSAFGINKLSVGIFNGLSSENVNGVQTNLTKEMTAISKILPYAEKLTSNGGKIDTVFVNNLSSLIDNAFGSEVVDKMVTEIVSTASGKWVNGETFLGMEMPKMENNQDVNNIISKVFSSWQNTTNANFKTDIKAVVTVLKVLTGDGVIDAMNTGNTTDLLDALTNENKNTITDLVDAMLVSNTLKNIIPDVLNIGLVNIYKALGVTIPDENADNYQEWANKNKITASADNITWDEEKVRISEILGNIARVYADYQIKYVEANEGKPENEKVGVLEVIDFSKIGKALDSMRASELFGNPSTTIFNALIDNEMFNILSADTKASLIKNFNDPTVELAPTFASLQEMVNVAIKVSNKVGDIAEGGLNKETITEALNAITGEGVNSDVIAGIVTQENLTKIGLDETVAGSISEVVSGIVNASSEDKENEINGIATIIDLVAQTQGLEENQTIEAMDKEQATATINAIANSNIIKDLIDQTDSSMGQISISDKIDADTKTNLSNAINGNANLSSEQQAKLLSMLVGNIA